MAVLNSKVILTNDPYSLLKMQKTFVLLKQHTGTKWFLSHEPVENDTCTYSQLARTTNVTATGDGVQGMVQVHPGAP